MLHGRHFTFLCRLSAATEARRNRLTRYHTSSYLLRFPISSPNPAVCTPPSWLFPKIDAALHHGGAGTTSASLRGTHTFILLLLLPFSHILIQLQTLQPTETAGIPTLIKPWFGDQYFWASRVNALGVSAFSHIPLPLSLP